MHFPRVALGALLTAGTMVLACSDDDTIVALNVSASEDVGYVSVLRVKITQSGQEPVNAEFSPSNSDPEAGAGGSRIDGQHDYRITLPSGWEKGKATVEVVSVANGQVGVSDTAEITIEPENVIAAYVELKREMPPMGGMGGTGGMGGGGAGGTQAGSGGAEAGSGGVTAGAGGAGAGAAGASAEGGQAAGAGGMGGS